MPLIGPDAGMQGVEQKGSASHAARTQTALPVAGNADLNDRDSTNMQSQSELDQPIWAVVSVSGVIASALDYNNAIFMAKKYHDFREQGVTIVTTDVAKRMRKKL